MHGKVTLYVATHNKTKKKYFGKTTRFFNEKDLNENYKGSGTIWKSHLKKYGDDVSVKIYKICSLNEFDDEYVVPIALKFSKENNIVDDYEIWLNQRPENGKDGGNNGISGLSYIEYYGEEKAKEIKLKQSCYSSNRSFEHQQKLNESLLGRKLTDEHKKNIGRGSSLALKGRSHEDIYGVVQSKLLKENLSKFRKNKSYEEIMGEEKALITKKKKSETMKNLSSDKNHIDKIKSGMLSKEAQKKLRRKVECPYCNKQGKKGPMSRWHFDNCKMKDKNEN